jgi:hypothetical protein
MIENANLATQSDFLEDNMNPYSPNDSTQIEIMTDTFDYLPLAADTLDLSQTQLTEAFTASQHISDATKRWSVYLGNLALIGFEQWLNQQIDHHIKLDRSQIHIPEPDNGSPITTVKNLFANGFRLCLIVVPGQPDAMIDIPKNAIDRDIAHFYVPVTIYEASQEIHIGEFLRGDVFLKNAQTFPLQTNRDSTCAIPFDWFSTDYDRFLLTLNSMKPATIDLTQTLQTNTGAETPSIVIKLARWFEREINELIEDLTWTLIPPWQIASAMRGDTIMRPMDTDPLRDLNHAEGFLPIFKSLTQRGIHLSPNSRAAYKGVQIGEYSLQLCVLAALLPSTKQSTTADSLEWSLMAILKPKHDRYLPDNIHLRISDAGSMLVEQGTQSGKPGGSLFIRAIGEGNEELTVTISYTNPEDGTSQTFQSIFTIDEV